MGATKIRRMHFEVRRSTGELTRSEGCAFRLRNVFVFIERGQAKALRLYCEMISPISPAVFPVLSQSND